MSSEFSMQTHLRFRLSRTRSLELGQVAGISLAFTYTVLLLGLAYSSFKGPVSG
uniref:Uncharacterized protein n=1 Tax=Rhizophora mucronata TaxID=61149 RepID=A0A2P2Q478_RHIMU